MRRRLGGTAQAAPATPTTTTAAPKAATTTALAAPAPAPAPACGAIPGLDVLALGGTCRTRCAR